MASCIKYNANFPKGMQDHVQKEADTEWGIIKEGLERNCASSDMVGILHFCKRLKRFVRCQYDMPATDKAQIVRWLLPR